MAFNRVITFSRGMRGRGVPPWVKKIVFGVLAKVLFIHLDVPSGGYTYTKAKVNNALGRSVNAST